MVPGRLPFLREEKERLQRLKTRWVKIMFGMIGAFAICSIIAVIAIEAMPQFRIALGLFIALLVVVLLGSGAMSFYYSDKLDRVAAEIGRHEALLSENLGNTTESRPKTEPRR